MFLNAVLVLVFFIASISRAARIRGPGRLENIGTGLFLEQASTEKGSPIIGSPFFVSKNSQRWDFTIQALFSDWMYDVKNLGSDLYMFANLAAGDGFTARPLATLFYFDEVRPRTYTLKLPLSNLVVTSPDKAGGQVTFQVYNQSDPAQRWFFTGDV